jgi:uncharacterized protein (TIGR02466 family)
LATESNLPKFALFPTLIAHYDFSKDSDLKDLADFVSAERTESHRLLPGAVSSYGTEKNILNDPRFLGIRSRLQNAVDEYVNELGVAEVKITNSWFNNLGVGQRVDSHRHEMSVISGALYLHADQGSAALRFYSPLAALRMHEDVRTENAVSANFIDMPCETGLLILFPSWLEHSTEVNQTQSRVTLSFNTDY